MTDSKQGAGVARKRYTRYEGRGNLHARALQQCEIGAPEHICMANPRDVEKCEPDPTCMSLWQLSSWSNQIVTKGQTSTSPSYTFEQRLNLLLAVQGGFIEHQEQRACQGLPNFVGERNLQVCCFLVCTMPIFQGCDVLSSRSRLTLLYCIVLQGVAGG